MEKKLIQAAKKAKYKSIKRKENKQKALEYFGCKCARCGIVSEHICIYDFHHKDPNEKEFRLNNSLDYSWEKLIIELNKCELLCANCHRIEHNK